MNRRNIYPAVVLAAALSSWASAGSVTFNGSTAHQHGSGFGSVLNLLSVQHNGSEYGSVYYDGGADVITGHAKNDSDTVTVQQLIDIGATDGDIGLVLNLNQTGSSDPMNIRSFTVRFQKADNTELFTAVFTPGAPNAPTSALTVIGQGTGTAGYLFKVNLSAAEKTLLYSDVTNRVGMFILEENAIEGSNDGQDSFFLGRYSGLTPGPLPIPLPVAAIPGGALLGAMMLRRRFRG